MNWRQGIPTSVTLAAMLAGFLSMLVTFEGMQGQQELYRWSAQLIMLAMILDGLDGNLARWLKGSSEFGAELDTYVDLTAFGISPAILIFAVTLQNKDPMWRVLLPSAVALSGVVRLARFKVKDPLRGQGGYAGLPITANAAWVALFVYISQTPPPAGAKEDLFSLQQGWFAVLFLVGVLVFVVLQVTNLRYPKPTKNAKLFGGCCALVVLLLALHLAGLERLGAGLAATMILIGTAYVIIGPTFVKQYKARQARKEIRTNGRDEQ
jgi:CDP-diacylglycerol--serine O-phosphatidyltransferase